MNVTLSNSPDDTQVGNIITREILDVYTGPRLYMSITILLIALLSH